MQSILTSQHLSKTFGHKEVLHDINLTVPRGQIYGLLGINGAGKSTLMKVVTGIIPQYQGRMTFEGQTWHRSCLKQIGALIEYPAAYENLSAADNLRIIALEEGIDQGRIGHLLAQLDIANTGKQRVKDFSLGMKQRLGIAMAMLKDPDFLILDEPFNGLDPYGIEELKHYLRQLTAAGKTIMVSSHILPEICDVADYIGILSDGNLVYQQAFSDRDDLEKIFFAKTHKRG